MWLDSGYVWKVERTECVDKLDMVCEENKVNNYSKMLGLSKLNCY